MTKPITNYGKLLAEIQYYEGIGNDFQVERLSKLLDAARERDKKNQMTSDSVESNIKESGALKD